MTEPARFVGVDPGPAPGIVALDLDGRLLGIVQCSEALLVRVLRDVLDGGGRSLFAVERFVVRGRNNQAQSTTRDQVANLEALFPGRVLQRSAAQVKPWATDERLAAAGLLDATKGMRHAKDAARHALYAAVKDGGVPDPMSKKWSNA